MLRPKVSHYRVMLVVWQLGWVDLVFQVPPVFPFALPILPKPQQPKQTQAGSVLTQLNLLPDHQHHPVLLGAAIAHNRLVGLATATTAADTFALVAPVTVSACCRPVISSLHSKCERGLKADNMRAQVFRNCRASTALAPPRRGVSLPWRKRRPCLLFLSNFDRYIRLSLVFRL